MDPKSMPKQEPGYRVELLDNEVLMFNIDSSQFMTCNQTASLIWHLCDGQHTVEEIVILIGDAFPDTEGIGDDVATTLDQFLEAGCITV